MEVNKDINKKEDELVLAKNRMRFWLIIGGACFLFAIFLAFALFYIISAGKKDVRANKAEDSIASTTDQTEAGLNLVERLLDGVKVPVGEENMQPLAIMIDNHADARPASGIDKAQLVIEAEAEGGITRFLAIFAGAENIGKIGPVRSARPYYADWAKEFSAVYAHVGGSPEALAKMSKENALHINEFYNGSYFWRDHERLAPHNVYTSSENLRKYLIDKNVDYEKFITWNFKDEEDVKMASSTLLNSEIKINFLLPGFSVTWRYVADKNSYERNVSGKVQTTDDGTVLTAKNIVIQYVRSEVTDEAKRQKFSHIGEGKAVVCLDGICSEGKWKKKDASFRTKFYSVDGEEFSFNPGTTWIEVVDPGYKVDY